MKALSWLLGLLLASTFALAATDEVDSARWQDQSTWSCASTIVVKPFEVTGKFKGKRSRDDYMRQFVSELSDAMVGRAGVTAVTLLDPAMPPTGDAVIEGQFQELSTGSRAKRFWVGFGAGQSRCEVTLTGLSLPDRRPLFSLTHARGSALGLKVDELGENVDEVARDVAGALLQARTGCDATASGVGLTRAP
jgi:hypothetical protein